MYEKISNVESNESIIASILRGMPPESGLTKIEYEGPFIVLYTKNPRYMLENQEIISGMVNNIKKRIIIRTDESIRSSEKSVRQIVKSVTQQPEIVSDIFFDPALGEASIFVNNFGAISELYRMDIELVEKTGWRLVYRRATENMRLYQKIYDILRKNVDTRMSFYKRLGERIFRQGLYKPQEACIFCLGGFNESSRCSTLLVTNDSKILIDFGIRQGCENTSAFLPRLDFAEVGTEDIDAVALSHGHLEHCGGIPFLYKYGYDGPIYCTEPTLPLMVNQQLDFVSRNSDATYSERDIEESIIHTLPLGFGSVTDISPDVRLTLSNSGHILGSSIIHLHIGNGDHNLVYTGDMKFGKSYTVDNAPWNFPRVETLIIESTNGSRDDKLLQREEAEQILTQSINTTLGQEGKVLIPVTSLGLAQEMFVTLAILKGMGKICPKSILVDKPIGEILNIYGIYSEFLSKELKLKASESNDPLFAGSITYFALKSDAPESIILSDLSIQPEPLVTSFLSKFLKDEKNKVIIMSDQQFSERLNLKDTSINGPYRILIGDKEIEVKCNVELINGFSMHSDYNQLLAYVNRLKPKVKRIIINHGEAAKCQNLATSINKIFRIQTQHPSVNECIKLL